MELGSGCGFVGRELPSTTWGPQFKSCDQKLLKPFNSWAVEKIENNVAAKGDPYYQTLKLHLP